MTRRTRKMPLLSPLFLALLLFASCPGEEAKKEEKKAEGTAPPARVQPLPGPFAAKRRLEHDLARRRKLARQRKAQFDQTLQVNRD